MAPQRPPHDPRSPLSKYPPHPEGFAYLRSGKLPVQFIAAQAFYERSIEIPSWRSMYDGKHVAILGTKPEPEIISGKQLEAVLHAAYSAWGHRPIFHTRVGAPFPRVALLPPPEPTYPGRPL